MTFQTPRGTRDFLPKDMAKRRKYFELVRKVLQSFGYGEVQTPAFEYMDLLEAKGSLGGAAVKDVFRLKKRKEDEKEKGLVFDPTTPIARIVASSPDLLKPIKWYYITRMWRGERPQAGRFREFWQAGCELIGSDRPEADAEILAVTYYSVKALGIRNFTLRVNSRKIMESLAGQAGIPEDKKIGAFRAIDKIDKIGEKEVRKELERIGVQKKAISDFISLIRSGPEKLRKELKGKALEDLKELEEIMDKARLMGVDNTKMDFSIIRGLDYYTGFIFETLVRGKERLGSVASGGRYDTLIGAYGGRPTPATGVGIGIDRMMEILEKVEFYPAKVFVASVKDDMRDIAIRTAASLRKSSIAADLDFMGRSLKKQLEYANKENIPYCIIIGPKEIKKKKVRLRDMKTGKEKIMTLKDATHFLTQ